MSRHIRTLLSVGPTSGEIQALRERAAAIQSGAPQSESGAAQELVSKLPPSERKLTPQEEMRKTLVRAAIATFTKADQTEIRQSIIAQEGVALGLMFGGRPTVRAGLAALLMMAVSAAKVKPDDGRVEGVKGWHPMSLEEFLEAAEFAYARHSLAIEDRKLDELDMSDLLDELPGEPAGRAEELAERGESEDDDEDEEGEDEDGDDDKHDFAPCSGCGSGGHCDECGNEPGDKEFHR